MLSVQNVSKRYQSQDAMPVDALKEVSFEVKKGEFLALVGPSGSGKSTMLNLIGGLDFPSQGHIELFETDLAQISAHACAEFRLKNLGFIFQSYNLLPVLSARENVEFILELKGFTKKDQQQLVEDELNELGIGPDMWDRRPSALSGGQQQRVAVARATVAKPNLILADEPTANLDSKTGAQLLDKMRHMNQTKNITFIFSTHDPMVMERASRIITLRDGKVESDHRKS